MINPYETYPIQNTKRLCFLKNIINNPSIIVGDYTYYDDPDDVHHFLKNVLYHFDFVGDKLIIGKFCQIATGVRFIMNGGNHAMNGYSAYPFRVFGHDWKDVPLESMSKHDTLIGNDVWIGNSTTMMPGVKIGDGAIIATNAVITKDVEPYTIVGGNPSRLIRKRFDDETIQKLVSLKWWDWSVEKISRFADKIARGDASLFQMNEI